MTTPFVTASAVPENPSSFDAPPSERLPDPLDDVVLALEEAEAAAAVREVVDVAGHRVDEVVHLATSVGMKSGADGRDRERSRRGSTT